MSLPSPLNEYLKTNDPPSADEAKLIEAHIEGQARIARDIAEKLEELDKARQSLQAQLNEARDSVQNCRGVISAAVAYGPPILDDLTRLSEVEGSRSLMPAESPDMLTTEDLAIHTEKVVLWKDGLRKTYDRVKTYLDRSGAYPLSIYFETMEILSAPSNPDITNLYSLLIDHLIPTSQRWEYINFDISAQERASPLIRLIQVPAESLPKRQISSHACGVQRRASLRRFVPAPGQIEMPLENEVPIAAFTGALRSQSLRGLFLKDMSKQVVWLLGANWPQLTSLTVDGRKIPTSFTEGDAIGLLTACPKLVECNLAFCEQMDMFFPLSMSRNRVLPQCTVQLPDLRILRLTGEHPGANGFPSRLNVPSLTQLSLHFSPSASTPVEESASNQVEWFEAHGEKLSDATLDYYSLTPSALLRCLENLPNITRLRLIGVRINEEFKIYPSLRGAAVLDKTLLARLTPASNEDGGSGEGIPAEQCFCPKMREFICLAGPLERAERDVLRMVLARYGDGKRKNGVVGPVCRIESVAMVYPRRRSESVNIVEELKRSGVDTSHLAMNITYNGGKLAL
ncbi:hypothetical protein NMY22_g16408 [Coprinellus aureogranulatus]|nr:hypothetical protein NMY22_g16408 [Coprinellus aureogranulatus]